MAGVHLSCGQGVSLKCCHCCHCIIDATQRDSIFDASSFGVAYDTDILFHSNLVYTPLFGMLYVQFVGNGVRAYLTFATCLLRCRMKLGISGYSPCYYLWTGQESMCPEDLV